MEDIIDIIVTETTNTIEITSQPIDEIIDVNIIDNREDVTLNVTPTVVEININSLTGNFGVNWGEIDGALSNQTDLQNALNLKADLVGGKVPSSQLPSYVDDVVEVANYAALPATGETGKIYVTIDTNYIYRWTGSVYVEIKDSSAVWGAITGTLSSQTDLQNALNAKLNLTGGTLSGALTLGSSSGDNQTLLNLPASNQLIYREGVGSLYGFNIESGVDNSLFLTNTEGAYYQTIFFGDSTGPYNIFGISTKSNSADWSAKFVVNQNGNVGLNKNNPTEILDVAGNGLFSGNVTANTIVKSGGTSSQFLKADGSVDSNTYATTSQLHNPVTLGTANGLSLSTQVLSLGLASSSTNGALSSTDWTTFNGKQAALSGTGFVKSTGGTISYDNKNYPQTSGLTDSYLPYWNSTLLGGSLTDSFISILSNVTYVSGLGLSTLNGIDIQGNYGGGAGGVKIRSYDATTGISYIDFANTGGRMYLGLNKSTSGGLMTNASAYATVLTTGLGTANLEFGTNATKRVTIDGSTGAVTLTSTITATGATLTGALSGTSATFSSSVTAGNTSIFSNGSSLSAIFSNGGAAGNYNAIELRGGTAGTAVNWQISKDNSTANAFELAPSTIAGGTTYGSPVFKIVNSGAATFSSSVTATQGIFRTDQNAYTWSRIDNQANNASAYAGLQLGAYGNTWGIAIGSSLANSNALNFVIDAGGTNSPKMTITSSGNVGIGTTSPNTRLHTTGSFTVDDIIYLQRSSSSLYLPIANYWNGSGNPLAGTKGDILAIGNAGGDGLVFVNSNTERMRITSSGNVGIGTTSPANYTNYITQTINGTNGAIVQLQSSGTPSLRLIGEGVDSYLDNVSTGALIFRTTSSSSERMRITSSGGVGINTTPDSGFKLHVNGYVKFNDASGVQLSSGSQYRQMYFDGFSTLYFWNGSNQANLSSAGAWVNASDATIKKDITAIKYGLSDLMLLNPCSYKMKTDDLEQIGFIAQEVEQIIPEVVNSDNKGMKGLSYGNMVALLTKSIQELKAELDTLKNK